MVFNNLLFFKKLSNLIPNQNVKKKKLSIANMNHLIPMSLQSFSFAYTLPNSWVFTLY